MDLGLLVPSKFMQDPAQFFLTHSNLNIDTFIGIAMCKLGTPYNNIAIFEELSDDIEGLIVEQLHELVFTVAKARLRTKNGHHGNGFVGGGLGIGVDLTNEPLDLEGIDRMRGNDILVCFGLCASLR
jgi:hypothetical protein